MEAKEHICQRWSMDLNGVPASREYEKKTGNLITIFYSRLQFTEFILFILSNEVDIKFIFNETPNNYFLKLKIH